MLEKRTHAQAKDETITEKEEETAAGHPQNKDII